MEESLGGDVCHLVQQEQVLLDGAQGWVQSGSRRSCSTCWSSGSLKLLAAQGRKRVSSQALAGLQQVCLQHPCHQRPCHAQEVLWKRPIGFL